MSGRTDPYIRAARRRLRGAQIVFNRLSPALQGMCWMVLAGLVFTALNTVLRTLAFQLHPFQAQCLRYACGALVMLPLILRAGIASYAPNGLAGQLWRGVVHTAGLTLWFIALPHMTLADMTAISFTGPIFVMIGAVLWLGERMIWARWVSSLIGFVGVLIVVAPKLAGSGGVYSLVMLGASPLFAASFLITKLLTRRDRPEVIVVWQSITVALFSLPFAIWFWQWPTFGQWGLFALSGVLGSTGHYCQTRALKAADASAIQPVQFLNIIWTTAIGFLAFGDLPTQTTLIGGVVIFVSTTWLARREARARVAA
jgi:drug/metabolite transporter (DMT)-like permease